MGDVGGSSQARSKRACWCSPRWVGRSKVRAVFVGWNELSTRCLDAGSSRECSARPKASSFNRPTDLLHLNKIDTDSYDSLRLGPMIAPQGDQKAGSNLTSVTCG